MPHDTPEASRARVRAWKRANPDKVRAQALTKYRLTLEDFDALRAAQGDACALCAEAFKSTPDVDHNHETGQVRGLLCRKCNVNLGHLEAFLRAGLLTDALRYLKGDP